MKRKIIMLLFGLLLMTAVVFGSKILKDLAIDDNSYDYLEKKADKENVSVEEYASIYLNDQLVKESVAEQEREFIELFRLCIQDTACVDKFSKDMANYLGK